MIPAANEACFFVSGGLDTLWLPPVDFLLSLVPGTPGCAISSSGLCGTPPFVFLVPGRLFLSPCLSQRLKYRKNCFLHLRGKRKSAVVNWRTISERCQYFAHASIVLLEITSLLWNTLA